MFKYVCLSTDLWKRSFIKEKKWIVAPFSKFYGKTSVGFCPNTGKRFFWEISFWGQQKKCRCYWKTLLGIFKILFRFRDRHIFREQLLEILNMFNTLTLEQIFRKTKTFPKSWSAVFYLKVLRWKAQHSHKKLSC